MSWQKNRVQNDRPNKQSPFAMEHWLIGSEEKCSLHYVNWIPGKNDVHHFLRYAGFTWGWFLSYYVYPISFPAKHEKVFLAIGRLVCSLRCDDIGFGW